jgi:hypothetical protein
LKADIGEILDPMDIVDLYDKNMKYICINGAADSLEGTEGEHFLMTATLLTDKK